MTGVPEKMWDAEINGRLSVLKEKELFRSLKDFGGSGKYLEKGERRLLNLSSNNYLGLADDARLIRAQAKATWRYGAGAASSRLISGNHSLYIQAEAALAEWKGCEAVMIAGSGYAANLGVLMAVAGRNDVVFSDKLNHASITDGILASRAEHKRYRHCDMEHLEQLLKKTPVQKRKIIVTDTVFSMDGDRAPLHELVALKNSYEALLIVDEAHATGIYGPAGRGLIYEDGLEQEVDLQIGTFSKALGTCGAYIVGKRNMIEYLINSMRPFIYTTALPPAMLGSIIEAIGIVQTEPERRNRLQVNSAIFRKILKREGFHTYGSTTQIVPIRIGGNKESVRFSELLNEAGIAAVAIRPPTVPDQDARLRFSITSEMDKDELLWAASTISRIGKVLTTVR